MITKITTLIRHASTFVSGTPSTVISASTAFDSSSSLTSLFFSTAPQTEMGAHLKNRNKYNLLFPIEYYSQPGNVWGCQDLCFSRLLFIRSILCLIAALPYDNHCRGKTHGCKVRHSPRPASRSRPSIGTGRVVFLDAPAAEVVPTEHRRSWNERYNHLEIISYSVTCCM